MRFHWLSRKKTSERKQTTTRLHFEQLEDRRMLATFTVNSLEDSSVLPGVVTLRSAIEAANSDANADNIRFDSFIFNGTIELDSALPTITEPVNIQVDPFFPISSDRITIDGTNLLSGSGLDINLTGPSANPQFMMIQGLIIENFPDHGINVRDLSGDLFFEIEINEINSNGGDGIRIDLPSGQDIISWRVAENIITNNTVGIRVSNVTNTEFTIGANTIGTNGTSTGDGNLSHGIYLSNVTAPGGNTQSGISTNTISGNGGHGIFLEDTFFVSSDIAFNEIGIDDTETIAIPNGGDGIHFLRSRTEVAVNDIGGNAGSGITLNNSDLVVVRNNRIGTSLGAFGQDFGNGGAGIEITNGSGQALVDSNFIWFNDGDGVEMSVFTTNRNQITDNDFRGNNGIPIDLLGIDGSNPNDNDDADSFGPNDLMNYPVIQTATIALSGSTWTVPFAFDVDIAGDYRFEFYRYDAATDDYDFIKSEDVLGVTVGALDFPGTVSFTDGSELSAGDRLSVLAIRTTGSGSGNTSELSLPSTPVINNDTTPPTILDVTLSGSSWAAGVEYAFSDLVAAGDQLRPIATQNVNTIEIEFSENVLIDGSELELRYTERLAGGNSQNSTVTFLPNSANFSYDDTTFVATWTFGNLGDGKYSLELSDTVTDVAGNALDGDWSARDAGTIDIYSDDPGAPANVFDVGNGMAGSQDYDLDGDEEFRLHFALLAGDYNGSGLVEGGDFLLWQNGDPATDGNGDGDSSIDEDDLTVWEAAFGNKLPLLSAGGDFLDDEWVNAADLVVWENGFGTEYDGVGFLAWQRSWNNFSVWYVGTPPLAAAASFATVGLPPQVLNVIVSGSTSPHDPFSLDTVDGSGNQLATVPVGGADTISIVFSEGVNVDANSLLVIGLTTATLPQVAEFSYDAATNTATWQMEGWALGDQYVLSLSDAITDVEGNNLDGEWTNPASITTVNSAVSTFPSGDGLSGGRFNFVMTLLPGDANLDGVVDISDFGILANNWGVNTGIVFEGGDSNGDGAVNFLDFSTLAFNWGTNLQNLSILADLDGNYGVDNNDIAIISANIGLTGATWADGDLDGDGQVTLDDLDLAFAQFGLGLSVAA